jgi:hypothetical protein
MFVDTRSTLFPRTKHTVTGKTLCRSTRDRFSGTSAKVRLPSQFFVSVRRTPLLTGVSLDKIPALRDHRPAFLKTLTRSSERELITDG